MANGYLDKLRGRSRTAMDDEQGRGRRAQDEYYQRATEYDPSEYATTVAEGTWGALAPELERMLEQRRAGGVARGRVNTGFQDIDEREVMRYGAGQLASSLAQQGFTAAGMDLRNIEGMGGHGERATGRYYDLLAGEQDREEMERAARRERKSNLWGTVGGLAGAAAGTLLGPAGTAIGNRAGSWLGGKVGG